MGMRQPWMIWHYMVVLIYAQWAAIIGLSVAGLGSLATIAMYSLAIHIATPFGVLYAFHADSKHLREVEASYQPLWKLWVAATILITPLLTSPIYLLRRRLAA